MKVIFKKCIHRICSTGVLWFMFPSIALTNPAVELLTSQTKEQVTHYSLSVETLLFLTALTFIPTMLLLMTGFTRIVIVLSLIRHAIGLQSTPSNQVIIGLSLFLTFFVMQPVLTSVYQTAYLPFSQQEISLTQALVRAAPILKNFMLRQTRENDLVLFAGMAHVVLVSPQTVPMSVLIPAFVVSELKTAFEIGFLLFIPFLIIDLIVSSLLLSMGMMMMAPSIISLPFKIMVFVMVDGWNLLVQSLVHSFH